MNWYPILGGAGGAMAGSAAGGMILGWPGSAAGTIGGAVAGYKLAAVPGVAVPLFFGMLALNTLRVVATLAAVGEMDRKRMGGCGGGPPMPSWAPPAYGAGMY